MPLVVQDSDPNDEIEQWQNKLTGKTISEEESSETTFNKAELPEGSRVIGPNTITTRDFRINRINVHTDEDGVVTHCTRG